MGEKKSYGLTDGLTPDTLNWNDIRSKPLAKLIDIDERKIRKSGDEHSFEAQVVRHKDTPVEELGTSDLLEMLTAFRQDIFSFRDANIEHCAALMALVTRHHVDKVMDASQGMGVGTPDLQRVQYKFSYDTDKLSSTPNLRKYTYDIAGSLDELGQISRRYPDGGASDILSEKMGSVFEGSKIRKTQQGYSIEFPNGSAGAAVSGEKAKAAAGFLLSEFGIMISPANAQLRIPLEDFMGKTVPRSLESLLDKRIAEQAKGNAIN